MQATQEISTPLAKNPKYDEFRQRIDQFVHSLQPQFLRKCFQDESSDQTLVEALTYSDDPFQFWEEARRLEAFHELRSAFMAKALNFKDL